MKIEIYDWLYLTDEELDNIRNLIELQQTSDKLGNGNFNLDDLNIDIKKDKIIIRKVKG